MPFAPGDFPVLSRALGRRDGYGDDARGALAWRELQRRDATTQCGCAAAVWLGPLHGFEGVQTDLPWPEPDAGLVVIDAARERVSHMERGLPQSSHVELDAEQRAWERRLGAAPAEPKRKVRRKRGGRGKGKRGGGNAGTGTTVGAMHAAGPSNPAAACAEWVNALALDMKEGDGARREIAVQAGGLPEVAGASVGVRASFPPILTQLRSAEEALGVSPISVSPTTLMPSKVPKQMPALRTRGCRHAFRQS